MTKKYYVQNEQSLISKNKHNVYLHRVINNLSSLSYIYIDEESNETIFSDIKKMLCLSYCIKGKAETSIKDLNVRYKYEEGEAILFWTNKTLSFESNKQTRDFESLCVYFNIEEIHQEYISKIFNGIGMKKISLPNNVLKTLSNFHHIMKDDSKENVLLLNSHTYYILHWIIKNYNFLIDEQQNITRNNIKNILLEVEKNINMNWSIEDIAKKLNMSKVEFYKAFQTIYQTTPKAYITEIKMNKAQHLLQKNHSIQEVSNLIGFSNRNNFSRAFTKYFGYCPKKHHKHNQ